MLNLPKICSSLQCQLMAISMTATVTVLGLAGGVASWNMYREVVGGTKQEQEMTLGSFVKFVEMSQTMHSPEDSVSMTVNSFTDEDTWFQVGNREGEILAQSAMLAERHDMAGIMPAKPELVQMGDRHFIVCGQWIELADGSEVYVNVVDDITRSYRAYWGFIRTLGLVGVGAAAASTLIGTLLIRRSLRPLHTLSQMAEEISLDKLDDSQLSLMQAPPAEIEQLMAAFNATIDRLADAWAKEQQLLGDISHELRTPLTIAQGYLEGTLRRGSNLNEIQRESLGTAVEEVQRTVRLLKDMMDLARVESGANHVRLEAIELGQLAQDIEMLARQITTNPLTVTVPEAEVWVQGNRDAIKQILFNLISNASRYSESDRPITITVTAASQEAQISVSDEGIGIAPEQQSRIFDRFYRTDSSRCRAQGGVGLGLSIATVLADQMRGSLSVQSQPSVGSTFTLHLSICQSHTRPKAGLQQLQAKQEKVAIAASQS